jgi:two-component system response regulator VicR
VGVVTTSELFTQAPDPRDSVGRAHLMPTILIIDDEYLIADILSFALEDEGFQTVVAGSGHKALDILDRERPDLIITDFMMPGMTGLELAESIKARAMHALTPIMLMSGAQAYMGAERPDLFDEVIEKPFDIDQVIDKIHALFKARL